ncbi:MAG: hypothetical protein RIS43_809, partial [Actinomycetota bacterium]
MKSWGLLPVETGHTRSARSVEALSEILSGSANSIPRGLGRSYGDVCTNTSGNEID